MASRMAVLRNSVLLPGCIHRRCMDMRDLDGVRVA